MTRTSYVLNSKHLFYFFLIMFLVIFMIVIMLYASLTANASLIYNSILFIGLVGLIIIVWVAWRRSEYTKKPVADYSLKNK